MSQNLNIWGVMDESGTDEAEYSRKVASGRRVAGVISSPVNARDLASVCQSCMKHCLYLLLCMAMKQCYGKRRRDLESGLYRWTTSEDR